MMHWKPRGWTLIGMLLLVIPGAMTVMKVGAAMQAASTGTIATTQVTDTVFRGDGTPAAGTVIVSWQAFTTANGESVPSGTTSATITAGALSLQLIPNAGSTPMGTYYTAVYHLDDGSVSREFWVVPVSQVPVQVSAIESTVLPTSVAMQTVSKSYVDTAIAAAVTGHPLDSSSPFVQKTGDTMTGPLVLPGDPTSTTQAADKHYVDVNVAGLAAGLGQKVSLLPATSQAVSQPVGTQLQVNILNGEEYASQYVSGLGSNGIANAVSSSDCASGCDVKVDRSYTTPEGYASSTWNSGTGINGGTHVEDDRNGQRRDTYLNPTSSLHNGEDAGQVVDVSSTRSSAAEVAAGGSSDPSSFALLIKHQGLTGGSNLFPASIEGVPYFKTNYNAMNVTGTYNTMGQHVLDSQSINCYGVGDCLIGSQFITSSGGFRDEADEGAHPFDLQFQEDSNVFQGSCSVGCTMGSTVVKVAATSGAGTQGEGRYLIDKNPTKVISSGTLTGGTGQVFGVPGAGATFSGTNFPVSVFLATAQLIPSQAENVAPGTVTVAIATSGVTAGFATNTAAVPSPSGVACVVDPPVSTAPHNYEMANYSVVDGTHLQMTLNKAHRAGTTIAFGGLCGYGLEQTVDTVGSIRQVFPVIGSYSSTGLYYAGGLTAIIGLQSNNSSFVNLTSQIATIVRNNGLVTVTTAGSLPVDVNGLTMTISGVADQSYNGSFVVTSTASNALTYAQAGANSTSSGGTVTKLTGGYALYPMAEVLGVFDTATKSVDGQLTLAPNTVAWTANDAVEEPHYYQQQIAADVAFVGQVTPRPTLSQTAGLEYEENVGPGVTGWTISNAVPATSYFSNGGTHTIPFAAYEAQGVWARTMDMQAGQQSVFSVHCNSRGCGRWNSGYDLFELDSSAGVDTINYQPTTSTLQMSLRGTAYQFSPQAFSAGTINAGTINATTLNGAVGAAQLPLFGASGSAHGRGAVPDPGATAGATRYLREDGSWAVPVGTGGSSGQLVGSSTPLVGNVTPIAGATADYNFLDGAGTTLTDNSGNGNNGTLGTGASAPTWTNTGLAFNVPQSVSLPASLNTSRTFYFAVYINTIPTAPANFIIANGKPVLLSHSLDVSGFNIVYFNHWDYGSGIFSLQTVANGTFPTYSNGTFAGFHVIAVTTGTGDGDLDHFYLDGVDVGSYGAQSSSAVALLSGNYFLGSTNAGFFAGGGFIGTYYRAVFKTTEDSAATVAANSLSILREVQSRPVQTTPKQLPTAIPQLFAVGDSITYGLNTASPATQAWPANLTLVNQPAYAITNMGIPSETVTATAGSEPWRPFVQQCQTSGGPSVAIGFAGTNDIMGLHEPSNSAANDTAQIAYTFSSLMNWVSTMKKGGCKVFVGTMLSRGDTTMPSGTSMDTAKDIYDAQILAQAVRLGADGVIDFAANPLVGADGASTNATYNSGDRIHPSAAGQLLLAAAASNTLNYYFGSNSSSPTIVTMATHTIASDEGYITASPTANQTLTLPDCIGPSGATYTVSNIQSAFAVGVVAGSASQLINGLAVGTVVPVPSNGSLTFRDVPNLKTVSGCHWEM
jgi:lysophospholipase L1-like esterase